jgi:sulfite reductase (NADPH) hemoprotein beta-component
MADLADDYSFDESASRHEQNLVLPHVKQGRSAAIWQALDAAWPRHRQCRT